MNALHGDKKENYMFIKDRKNSYTHIRDEKGNIRVRIDPADGTTPYEHMHLYDKNGRPLDKNGNIVDRKSPEAHIKIKQKK